MSEHQRTHQKVRKNEIYFCSYVRKYAQWRFNFMMLRIYNETKSNQALIQENRGSTVHYL